MAQILGLPKLSPTMEEGVLVRWTKKQGDKVSPGDLIAEVETDKANMDFNVEDEGVLLELLVKEGETVKLVVTSEDVTHGFFLRPLKIDTDITPGQTQEITVTPQSAGTFTAICHHFCGAGHGSMKLTVVVE